MKIEIYEGCYSISIRFDGIDILTDEYQVKPEYFDIIINALKKRILSKEEIMLLMDIVSLRSNKFNLTDEEFENLDDDYNLTEIMSEKIDFNLDLIIEEIINSKDEFDSRDIMDIVKLMTSKYQTESDYCEQCFNTNYSYTFNI